MNRRWPIVIAGAFAMACGPAAGASSNTDAAPPLIDDAAPADAAPPLVSMRFVASSVIVPSNAAEARALGLDLDVDKFREPDNKLGDVLATLVNLGGPDPQIAVDQMVDDGAIIHLFDVQAYAFDNSPLAKFWVLVGQDTDNDPLDNFTGTEMFTIKPNTPVDGILPGDLTNSHVTAGPGSMPLQIALTGNRPPFTIHLVGAHAEMDVDAGNQTMSGRIGGGITEQEIDTVLIPAIQLFMSDLVTRDCNPLCAPGSTGETLVNYFDGNNDNLITVDELRQSVILQSMLSPDVDLFDANGNFNPNSDGQRDSLSIGIGITAVAAQFDLP